jgi:hypothetical protein
MLFARASDRWNMNRRSFWQKQIQGVGMKTNVCAITLGLLFANVPQAMADDIHLGAAFSSGYSDGDYGTNKDTNVLLGLSTLSAKTGNFQFNVSVPYMRISGRGLVVMDAAGNPIIINRNASLPADVRSGFGDLNLSTTYAIPPEVLDDFKVSISGRVKVPTASGRRRLSTGEADYGMSVDVAKAYDRWQPFVTIGYLIAGRPSGFVLKNTVSASAGTSYDISDSLVAITSYDYDSPSSPLVASSQNLFWSLSWIVNDKITLTGYATKGISSGSPNVGTGLILAYGFN